MDSVTHLNLFREHVPPKFLREMFITLYDCYADAYDQCQSLFEEPEAVNMRPFHRRALIEQGLREIVKDFDGVSATAERGLVGDNGQLGWWFHTLVQCGPIAFTQNTVGDPNELVRPSLFRQEYAAMNRQLLLFPNEKSKLGKKGKQLPEGIRLYGILLHGQSDRPSLPGFAVIRFPNHEYDAYVPGSIDLFQEFPEIVGEKTKVLLDSPVKVEVEKIEEPIPQLRVSNSVQDVRA